MADLKQKTTRPAADWRFSLINGLAIGLGFAVARDVATAWAPSLGTRGAFAVSLVAAGVVGGLVTLVLSWLLNRGSCDGSSRAVDVPPREGSSLD